MLVKAASIWVFLWALMVPGAVLADNFTDCLSNEPSKRISACTAVIDDPTTSAISKAQALEMRSLGLMIAGKFEESMRDLDESLAIDPESYIALNGRAWTLFRWKKTDAGMDDVNKSLARQPNYAAAWDTRAHLYQLRGNFDKAFTEYEAAVGFGGENFIRTYQCGLRERGFYKGPVDGIYSAEVRAALKACAFSKSCDPLPDNEFQTDCDALSS